MQREMLELQQREAELQRNRNPASGSVSPRNSAPSSLSPRFSQCFFVFFRSTLSKSLFGDRDSSFSHFFTIKIWQFSVAPCCSLMCWAWRASFSRTHSQWRVCRVVCGVFSAENAAVLLLAFATLSFYHQNGNFQSGSLLPLTLFPIKICHFPNGSFLALWLTCADGRRPQRLSETSAKVTRCPQVLVCFW